MVWSPLAGGAIFTSNEEKAVRLRLTLEQIAGEIGAQSIDQVVYAWILHHPAQMMPIVGSGRPERIRFAVDSLSLSLDRQQWFSIWSSALGHEVP
jgi:predicted oxidoreductase